MIVLRARAITARHRRGLAGVCRLAPVRGNRLVVNRVAGEALLWRAGRLCRSLIRRLPSSRCVGCIPDGAVFGQSTPCAIHFTEAWKALTDAQGRVIPGVRSRRANSATGNERSELLADATGSFHIADLVPGHLCGRASRAELRTVARGVGGDRSRQNHQLAPHLAIGGHSETVLVRSETPGLETSSAAITTNLSNTALENLPSNGRRWSNFALLTAGVTPDQNGYGLLSFRGISVLLNNNTIDGVDNNQAFFSEERGRTRIGYSTTQAAVQEFQVNTSNYAAEYGRAAGGVVNTVTRSGGNEFHGQAFFFDRDNDWGATNPFTTLTQRLPGRQLLDHALPADRLAQAMGRGSRRTHPARQALLVLCLRPIPAEFSRNRAHRRCTVGNGAEALRHALRAGDRNPGRAHADQRRGGAGRTTTTSLRGLDSMLGPVPRTANQYILFPKIDWDLNERNHLIFQYNRMRWNSPAGVQTAASSDLRHRQLRQRLCLGGLGHRSLELLPHRQPAE